MWLATVSGVILTLELVGIAAAVNAILNARTPQGAIAWGLALVCFPYLSLPLYLVFGRSKFNGTVNSRRASNDRLAGVRRELLAATSSNVVPLEGHFASARVLSQLSHLPFLNGNSVELLINGERTYDAMFSSLDQAKDFVLAEFFIVRDDETGRAFCNRLIAAAQRGCRVYLLYDEVGSRGISEKLLGHLRASGVCVSAMKPTKGLYNRFQINFRNHRKTVVIDGDLAFVGGLNVADDYVGKHVRLTHWRDTHLKFSGPAVLSLQLSFVEDWLWATGDVLELEWKPAVSKADDKVLFVMPSGPDDDFETCSLFFTHTINSAKKRIWIATPYFVPDIAVASALKLAAFRGVDVRVIIPGLADKWIVKQAAYSYISDIARSGVKFYEYGRGFMHQKVAVVDERASIVGTANMDNRSFRLNFEVTTLVLDESFTDQVEAMLSEDLENSRLICLEELNSRGVWHRLSSRGSRLFAPVL